MYSRLFKRLQRFIKGGVESGTGLPQQRQCSRAQLSGSGIDGLNVAGYISGEFGLGEAIRALIRSLDAVEIPYVLNNIEVSWHRNQDRTYRDFSESNPYPANLIGANPDQALEFYRSRGETYFQKKYNIGSWFWELSTFPKEWLSRFDCYDEIWVASQFTAESLSRVSPVPVVKMTYPIFRDAPIPDRKSFDIDESCFAFLTIFDFRSSLERKNPLGVIDAFRRAFSSSDDAVLVVKSINSDADPEGTQAIDTACKGLKVQRIDEHVSASEMSQLMASCDCYVSLHRSEGLGLGMAQSMGLGKAVIGTGYSGNLDFMNVNNSLLVKYSLKELEQSFGPYEKGSVWAEPDLDHAAQLMRRVFEDPHLVKDIGQRAAFDISSLMNVEVAGAEIRERLKTIGGR